MSRKLWLVVAVVVALSASASAASVTVPMTGSKWSLYASGGVIKCGVSVCGKGQIPGTLPNGDGIYFDFPVAPDVPVGAYVAESTFTGTGPNDATWLSAPPITAPVTYCVRISAVNVYTDVYGPHDAFTWGTEGSCTNGGTVVIQSTSGTWLSNGVLVYFARMSFHTVGDTWTVRYGYGTAQTDWRGYLMTVPAVKAFSTAQVLSMRVELVTTGAPVFGFHGDGDYRCDRPVTIRPHFQKGAWSRDPGDNYRWWAKDPYSFTLAHGSATISIPLQADKWVQTWGKTGSSTTALTTAFTQSIANIGSLGAAIGGGCSYGHGANINQGTARLMLRAYAIQ